MRNQAVREPDVGVLERIVLVGCPSCGEPRQVLSTCHTFTIKAGVLGRHHSYRRGPAGTFIHSGSRG